MIQASSYNIKVQLIVAGYQFPMSKGFFVLSQFYAFLSHLASWSVWGSLQKKSKKNPIYLFPHIISRATPHSHEISVLEIFNICKTIVTLIFNLGLFFVCFLVLFGCLLLITYSKLSCLKWIFESPCLVLLLHRAVLDSHFSFMCHITRTCWFYF